MKPHWTYDDRAYEAVVHSSENEYVLPYTTTTTRTFHEHEYLCVSRARRI